MALKLLLTSITCAAMAALSYGFAPPFGISNSNFWVYNYCYKYDPTKKLSVHWNLRLSINGDKNENDGDDEELRSNNYFIDEDCFDLCEDIDLSESPSNSQMAQEEKSETSASPREADLNHATVRKSPEKARSNLELHWDIEKSKDECDAFDITTCSEPCRECRGTGVVECGFCKGVGYIDFGDQVPGTMGFQLMKKNGGFAGLECPVCNEDGEQTCAKCRGNGWIANWRMNNITELKP